MFVTRRDLIIAVVVVGTVYKVVNSFVDNTAL